MAYERLADCSTAYRRARQRSIRQCPCAALRTSLMRDSAMVQCARHAPLREILSGPGEDESMSDTNRREVLGHAVALTALSALAGPALVASNARAQSAQGAGVNGVKALVFDVFGT